MSAPNFEVAICHGSFKAVDYHQELINTFKSQGINAVCPVLPTSGLVARPAETSKNVAYPLHSDDAIVFRETLEQMILESGKLVIVLVHSSGGIAGTEAVTPNLEYKTRRAHGLPGGVIGIFYMCAYIVMPGESLDDFWMRTMKIEDVLANFVFKSFPNKGEYQMGQTPFYIAIKDPKVQLFHNLSSDEAEDAASTATYLTGPQNARLTNASYLRLPCAYLYTKKDKIIPLHIQEEMVTKIKGLGVHFKEFTYDGGHSPSLSWKDGMVECVTEFAKEIMENQ